VEALDTKTIFSECSAIVESVIAVKNLVDAVSKRWVFAAGNYWKTVTRFGQAHA
jgi:hypothetical protein